ncbi:unnamed protein product [Rhodiola kirilowii]
MMVERRIICVVLVLGYLSIGTDFGADRVRVYKKFVLASLLEIIAAVALAIAHAITYVKTGCFCCIRVPRDESNLNCIEIATVLCFRLSWFTFAAASLCFLGSAVFDLGYFRDIWKVKPSFFDNGALLSFYCHEFDLAYYILYSAITSSSTAQVIPHNHADIELGQPCLSNTSFEYRLSEYLLEDKYIV